MNAAIETRERETVNWQDLRDWRMETVAEISVLSQCIQSLSDELTELRAELAETRAELTRLRLLNGLRDLEQ
jgi:uncharacterized coiled-coil protein SlyX